MNALGTPGTAKRRFFYGPGADNFDMAVGQEAATHRIEVSALPRGGLQRLQPHAVQRPELGRRRHRQLNLRQRHQRSSAAHPARRSKIHFLIATNGSTNETNTTQKRYKSHEVTAPRAVGPSGRTPLRYHKRSSDIGDTPHKALFIASINSSTPDTGG